MPESICTVLGGDLIINYAFREEKHVIRSAASFGFVALETMIGGTQWFATLADSQLCISTFFSWVPVLDKVLRFCLKAYVVTVCRFQRSPFVLLSKRGGNRIGSAKRLTRIPRTSLVPDSPLHLLRRITAIFYFLVVFNSPLARRLLMPCNKAGSSSS